MEKGGGLKKILALCDSPTMTTGFARVAQNLFRRWAASGVVVDCWGIGFAGWDYKKHPYVNELFPAGAGGIWYQPVNLTLFLGQLARGGYTHVWIMQDTFLLYANGFPKGLRKVCRDKKIHATLYFPVDAALDPKWTEIIAAVDCAVAYTKYGREEARRAMENADFHCRRPIAVIPHGVDTTVHFPYSDEDRKLLRGHLWTERWLDVENDFLMLNVNMNQRRKDVARSLEILAELKKRGVPAKLLMHMQESSSDHLSLEAVGAQLGLKLDTDWAHHGAYFRGSQSAASEAKLVEFYNAADLYLTTSLGEGWGLGITEALGCGLPVAVPMHTSCLEIAEGLMTRGMGERVVPMATELFGWFLENDNSRRRQRTDVSDAADKIEIYYRSGRWKERPRLNAEVAEWLSWDRIAAEFLRVMGVEVSSSKVPEAVQTSVENAECGMRELPEGVA